MSRAWIHVEGEDILPECPQCHSTAHVKKGQLYKRKYYPLTRWYNCLQCKGPEFIKPSARGWKHPENDPRSVHPDAPDRARYRQALNELNELVPPPPNMSELEAPSSGKRRPKESVPVMDAIYFGNWKIKQSLARSLAAMFRVANGFTPDQDTLNAYISTIVEAEVASFRLSHREEIFRSYGKPVAKPVDPIMSIREEIISME